MDFTECYQHTCSAVALAARQADDVLVRKLTGEGYSVDVRDNRGWNPLHEAAFCGAHKCIRLLLRAARSRSGDSDYVNSLTHDSATPLYLAAKQGHLHVVQHLLQAGADVNQTTSDGASPLFAAVDGGHKKVAKLLVRQGSAVNHTHSLSGWSCLHQAVFKGHPEMVRFLVGVAHVDPIDDFEITPLFVAAQYGQRQCLDILADAGADVNRQSRDLATPLLIASQEGHLSCVTALLEHGADPNLYCNEDEWQLPIHAAAEFGHIRILERLLPVTDLSCGYVPHKVSPLYSAVLGGQLESVRLLLKEGYSPDAQDCGTFGFSSPLAACLFPHDERLDRVPAMVRQLLVAGARVEGSLFKKCLQLNLPSVLQLLLANAGLPTGEHLQGLVAASLEYSSSAVHWLPLLLQAGLHPSHLIHPTLFQEATSDVINFLLEFTDWKRLPPSVSACLLKREADSTWKPHPHLQLLPPLSHLCRLAVMGIVSSQSLAREAFVRQLPVPALLQDYLRFADVYETYNLPPAVTAGRE
ncbi:ankyrin repeat and SOCS box protein 3-like [Arapaima gigas]